MAVAESESLNHGFIQRLSGQKSEKGVFWSADLTPYIDILIGNDQDHTRIIDAWAGTLKRYVFPA
jgi:hypothetical protein